MSLLAGFLSPLKYRPAVFSLPLRPSPRLSVSSSFPPFAPPSPRQAHPGYRHYAFKPPKRPSAFQRVAFEYRHQKRTLLVPVKDGQPLISRLLTDQAALDVVRSWTSLDPTQLQFSIQNESSGEPSIVAEPLVPVVVSPAPEHLDDTYVPERESILLRRLEERTGDWRTCEREKEDLTMRVGALEEKDKWREEQERLRAEKDRQREEEYRWEKELLFELQKERRQREEAEVRRLAVEALMIEAIRLALRWQSRPDFRLTPRDMISVDRAWSLLERKKTCQDSMAAFFDVSDSQTFFAALRAPLARKLRLARHLLTKGKCPLAQEAAEAAHAIATDPKTTSIRLTRNSLSHPLPDEEQVLQLVEEHASGKVVARDVVRSIIKARKQRQTPHASATQKPWMRD